MMNALKMNFNDFVTWAAGHVLMGIAQGDKLRTLMHIVVDHTLRNEMFSNTGVINRLQPLIEGCPHCDYDEAEGGVWDHCDACRLKVTREVVKIVSGE